jgi:hypothetical protein
MYKIKFLEGSEKEYETLQGANLEGANLEGADLTCADLRGADLTRAYLKGANLTGADLRGADLTRANLTDACLRGAYLKDAYLTDAYLTDACLTDADLRGADLRGANLRGADLRGANLPNFQICPEVGAFRAFKKLRNGLVAELGIPLDAQRTSSLAGRKCRASKVKVLRITGPRGPRARGAGLHDGTAYAVGQYTHADSFDGDIRIECTHGIHFFVTRKEAEEYHY